MRVEPGLFVACYDISDAKRLRRVYKIMRGFGDHMQYSVFRCVLSPAQKVRLETRLLEVLKQDEDQVLIVPLGQASKERSWRMETLGLPLCRPERVVRVF